MEAKSQQKAAINKEKKLKKKFIKKKTVDHYQTPQQIVEKNSKNLTTNDATTSKLRNNRVVEKNQNAVPENCIISASHIIADK